MIRPTSPTTPARPGRRVRAWVTVVGAAALVLASVGSAAGAGPTPALPPSVGSISGVVTSSDGPVAGAVVPAHLTDGVTSYFTTSAADGSYTLGGLTFGTYRVEFDGRDVFHSAGYWQDAEHWDDADLINLSALSSNLTGVNAVLAETGWISGTVARTGGPAVGVSVSAHDPATGASTEAYTDSTGYYRLRGLPAGAYILRFRGMTTGLVSEYYNNHLSWADADLVTVVTGVDNGGYDAALAVGGGISGTVTGPSGPVGGVWVGASSDLYYDGTLTAADGTYELVGLAAGQYRVHADGSTLGLVSEFYDDALVEDAADLVNVATSVTTPGIDLALVDGGSIAGTVSGPGGPLPDFTVRVVDLISGLQGESETAADGTFFVGGLPAGTYEVEFEAPLASGLRGEWFDNQVTQMTATPVALAAGQDRSGVNAVLADLDDPLFSDVPHTAVFHAEIEWLAYMGVTSGYPDGTFHPSAPVERQAMAAFLYRYAGEPVFTPPATPSFSDVPVGSPFYTEVEWLADTGITTGWPDGTFRPTATVERQAMAAFLYRFGGEPAFTPPATATFSDVPPSAAFFHEIEWLADIDVSHGWPDGTFRPSATVERQAMAAFLMRFDTWAY